MSIGNSMEFTQLDSVTYQNMINQRIRELEVQYATLNLRIQAPSPTEVVTEQDRQNLNQIVTSLDHLRGVLAQAQNASSDPKPADGQASA